MAWTAGLAIATAVLLMCGGGRLAPPPLAHPGGWLLWLTARDPAVAIMAIVRVLALGACGYLCAATGLGVLARLSHLSGLIHAADRVTVPLIRRLLHASLGTGLLVSSLATPAGAAASTAHPAAAEATEATDATDLPVLRWLGPAEEPTAPAPPTITPPAIAPPAPPHLWTVQSGDSFWHIADATVSQRLGRPATDAEVLPYWRALIDRNRSRLRHPANPDLLFAGQQLELPA
jgi:hypothetical protein